MAKILAFSGSNRKDSWNYKLVKIAAAAAEKAGAEVTLFDLAEHPMPLFGQDLEAEEGMPANAEKFKQLLIEHDGFLIATPEHNSSYSAALKNAIDWASRVQSQDEPALKAFKGKTAAIMACSPGALGGMRGLVPLRMLLSNISVLVLPQQLAISQIHTHMDEHGLLTDASKQAGIESIANELVSLLNKTTA